MTNPPDQTDDSTSEPFRLQFSIRTLLLLFTVAAATWPLMKWGVPHLIALLMGPVSTRVYLAKRGNQPAELVFVVSAFFTGLTWGSVALYAAFYSVLVESDHLLSIGEPFVIALMITLVGGFYGSVCGIFGLMIQEWRKHGSAGETTPNNEHDRVTVGWRQSGPAPSIHESSDDDPTTQKP
jgi:hypothetical protein